MDKVVNLKNIIKDLQNISYQSNVVYNVIRPIKARIKIVVSSIWLDSEYLEQIDRVSFENMADFSLRIESFNQGKSALVNLIKLIIEDIEVNKTRFASPKSKEEHVLYKSLEKVFIVHGQDELAKTEVARFVERLGLTPIILHEQVSSGKTIIEKIEVHSNVGFGIVLYTPCDIGGRFNEEGSFKNRARQNVVFEHGFLIGKLGRQNVCALVKGQIELPNDMSGIVYTAMDNNKAWQYKLADEMKNSGYRVDKNKL